jgi:hypothetical protein
MAGSMKAINKLCNTLSRVYGVLQYHTEEWRGGLLPTVLHYIVCMYTCTHI